MHQTRRALGLGKTTLAICCGVLLAGCSLPHDEPSSAGGGCGVQPVIPEGSAAGWACVSASHGGTVEFPTKAGIGRLEVPAGALGADTRITVYTDKTAKPGRARLAFEPDGLMFSKPARLILPYDPAPDGSTPKLSLYHSSDANAETDVGSERHRLEPFENAAVDTALHTVSADMHHFSSGFFFFGVEKYAYVVVDLPGKYLRPGDGVFVLTNPDPGKYNWMPGHVGMVRSVDPETGETVVIESTTNGGPTALRDGVQENPLDTFKTTYDHVFMGARRPSGAAMTDDERRSAVEFGRSKLWEGYSIWGAPLLDGVPVGWSCSGFVEASWDAAGRGAAGLFSFFPSPVELYADTRPVDRIEVRVGEEVRIPVYPVLIHPAADPWGLSTDGYYQVGNAGTPAVTAAALPPGATFTVDPGHRYQAQTLAWTPRIQDGGREYTVTLSIAGTVTLSSGTAIPYSVTEKLTLAVAGAGKTFDVFPVSTSSKGLHYFNTVAVPEDAKIVDVQLVDTATDAFPTNPVFPGQYIDDYSHGRPDDWPNDYAMSFSLWKDDPNAPKPASPTKQWHFWVDFETERYTGLD